MGVHPFELREARIASPRGTFWSAFRRARRDQPHAHAAIRRSSSRSPHSAVLRPRASHARRQGAGIRPGRRAREPARAHRSRSGAARCSGAPRRGHRHDGQSTRARSRRACAHRPGRYVSRRRGDVRGRDQRFLAGGRPFGLGCVGPRGARHGRPRAANACRRQGLLPHAELQQPHWCGNFGRAPQEPRRVVAALGCPAHRR